MPCVQKASAATRLEGARGGLSTCKSTVEETPEKVGLFMIMVDSFGVWIHLGVSINGGTLKSSILDGDFP